MSLSPVSACLSTTNPNGAVMHAKLWAQHAPTSTCSGVVQRWYGQRDVPRELCMFMSGAVFSIPLGGLRSNFNTREFNSRELVLFYHQKLEDTMGYLVSKDGQQRRQPFRVKLKNRNKFTTIKFTSIKV